MTPELRAQILTLAEQHQPPLTASEIAARVGCTRNVVSGLCHRNGRLLNAGMQIRKSDRNKAFVNWNGGIQPREPETRQPKGTCKWIDGDPQKSGWTYCGKRVAHVGGSWCPEHRVRVFAGVAQRERGRERT